MCICIDKYRIKEEHLEKQQIFVFINIPKTKTNLENYVKLNKNSELFVFRAFQIYCCIVVLLIINI